MKLENIPQSVFHIELEPKTVASTPISAEQTDKPYPKTLSMQGGNTDFEYVDAIGGIKPSNHQVEKSYLIWEASIA